MYVLLDMIMVMLNNNYAVVRVVSYILIFLLHGRYGLSVKNQMVSFFMMCHSMAVNVSLVYSFPQIKGLFYLLI